ncbi:MAG: ABC transporter permease [Dehalococcoidia bacterium]
MDEIARAFVTALRLIFTGDKEVLQIAGRTLAIAFSSMAIAAMLFIPLGSLIYFHSFWGKRLLVNIIQTLFSLPTVFVGLLVFITLSKSGPLGGLELLFTPGAMIIGQVILISPIITGLTISSLSGVNQEIRDTAVSLGATRFQTIKTVMLEARYATVTAVLIGFGRAISEVGSAIIVGGNIKGFTRTLTTAMSLETSTGNIELSMALGIILISLALMVSILANRLQQR